SFPPWPIGWNVTFAPARGLPFSVTFPETVAVPLGAQPENATATHTRRTRTLRIGLSLPHSVVGMGSHHRPGEVTVSPGQRPARRLTRSDQGKLTASRPATVASAPRTTGSIVLGMRRTEPSQKTKLMPLVCALPKARLQLFISPPAEQAS